MNTVAYVVFYSLISGKVGMLPIVENEDVVCCRELFLFASESKRVWTRTTQKQLVIDDPVHQLSTWKRLEEQMVMCAFSTPERAMKCLALWIETKGQQDLPAE